MKILNVFNSLTLKQIFWKTKTLLQNTEVPFFSWKGIISIKTALSEANFKTNKMVTTKWTYNKGRSFASNYLIFLKILFQFKNSYKELICCTKNPNANICTFYKCWTFIWWCFFHVSILKLQVSSQGPILLNQFRKGDFRPGINSGKRA